MIRLSTAPAARRRLLLALFVIDVKIRATVRDTVRRMSEELRNGKF